MNLVSSVFDRKMPNKSTKRPWAVYLADNYAEVDATLKTGIIPDVSINNRSAATTINVTKTFDSNYTLPIVAGGLTAKIAFPIGSLPPTYTILCVSRFSTGINRNRILASPNVNFTHGHYQGSNIKIFNVNTMSNFNTSELSRTATSWCVAISTNSTGVPLINSCGVNNAYIGTFRPASGVVTETLCINNSKFGTGGQLAAAGQSLDMSDFQFHALVIYDQGLTVEEMTALSASHMANIKDLAL
jgi:hypothetical protein